MSMKRESSTPSLVGVSVRSINDSNNPDFCDDRSRSVSEVRSSSQLLEKIHSSTQLNKLQGSYTTVDELNREGALLTDDNSVDLDSVVHGKLGDDDNLKKSVLKKKKKRQQEYQNTGKGESSGAQFGATQSSSSGSFTSPSHSPSQTRSSSLVTSRDPLRNSNSQVHVNPRSTSNFAHKNGNGNGNDDDDQIRNSYGEFITNRSHRPHLAGGASYQSTNSYESEETPRERSGRSARKEEASRDFLRSLSRSLSRDPKRSVADHELNSRVVQRPDFEGSGPHVITEEIEDEQDQGALLNDEGDEQYTPELQQAASREETKQPVNL
ncbi:LAFA_0G13652g1_1 [Lachancea sp. 'fantastica']|nr:LAFA_0G13652g1_1 [Lachancea sp. 'fantastica']